MRRALPVLLLALVAGGCTASGPDPAPPPSAPPAQSAPADPRPSEAASSEAAATPTVLTETNTPMPLPPVPTDPVPGEVVRARFGSDDGGHGVASHTFGGRVVTLHVLCETHNGEVAVELWVDGARHSATTSSCQAPHFVEDAAFGSGTKRVELRVAPSEGASGVAYVTDGEI